MEELKYSFVAIDFETTGFLPKGEIIEIGMVKVVDGQVAGKYSKLIKPENPIPEEIAILTGITDEMVADKPAWKDIQQEVINFIGDYFLVAHNAEFDKGFLERALGYKLPNLWIDTWDLAKITLPALPSYQLKNLADYFEIKAKSFHRALNDAETTVEVLLFLIKKISGKSPYFLERIINILDEDKQGLTVLLKTALKSKIAGYWNEVTGNTDLEHRRTEVINLPLLFSELEKFFLPEGTLGLLIDNYEFRPQQLEMAQIVKKALVSQTHALIEAGTGTGKSLAYLIPALLWAQENNVKIVISTNTIALQEQLYGIDIPFLEQSFDCKLPVALVKGRNNYLCLRRYYKLLKEKHLLSWREKVFLAQITNWLEQTDSGDKEEINLNISDNEIWAQLASQVETCTGNRCSYNSQCYFMKTRKEAEKNKIIITNHSLLLLDVKLDNKVLPQYDYVIIDEAHNLEEEALKQFAREFNFVHIKKIINQLVKGKNTALINQIGNFLKNNPWIDKADNIFQVIAAIKENCGHLEAKLTDGIKNINSENTSQKLEYRITDDDRNSKWWYDFSLILKDISYYLAAIVQNLSILITRTELIEDLEDTSKEIGFLTGLLSEANLTINKFTECPDSELVYWLQILPDNLVLIITPIYIADILSEKLFSLKKSVILTSATLAVNQSFDHIISMYGLEKERVLTLIAQSPFDYHQQSVIYIPNDLPEPYGMLDEEYAKYVTASLTQILPHVYGGILVLFTSNQLLNTVYYNLKKEEVFNRREILAYGKDGGRKTLIEALKNNPNEVILMGSGSFWEGIDIQGLGLTTVVIVKLPFSPPTRPVIAARLELLEKNKQNSFYKYSLPSAILKFRQGYGRLIRTGKDWGALIILDKRVVSKNYGRKFIGSLPPQPVITASTKDIAKQLSCWMGRKAAEK
ncbi:MAG: DEAD/DEAH box helicase [Clostridia bacterium]|nr:DEAD/DEAH box helicase [Clostridia bacterium]